MTNRIKELRLEAGLTQEQLAKEVEITRQAISQYEKTNRQPKAEIAQKLADYFNVSVTYLQGIDDEDYIEFACNECGYTFKVPRELKTKVVSCPFCSCQETSYEV